MQHGGVHTFHHRASAKSFCSQPLSRIRAVNLESLLTRFRSLDSSGPFDYEWCFHHDGGARGTHVVVGSIVHGNEVGSLPAIVEVAERLAAGDIDYGGRITFFLGNPEASRENVRFLESDLNRVFTDTPPDDHEGARSLELKPILRTADMFLDLHQTIEPTESAFYTFPFNRDDWHWARMIGNAPIWSTRAPDASFSANTCCVDEFVRGLDKPGLTLELGQKGFSEESTDRTMSVLQRLLSATSDWDGGMASIEALAQEQPDFSFVETAYAHPFSDRALRLRDGLSNLIPVQSGETLSAPGSPTIEAPIDGLLMFPKYPGYDAEGQAIGKLPNELFRIVTAMDEHPIERWNL